MFNVSALINVPLTGPRSILRVLQVFARLGAHPEGQTLSQLCHGLSLPKTTLFTMLKVLESAHYLSNEGGAYRLGSEAVALGASMAESPARNFPNCANGVLQNLSQRTGESDFLAVLTPDRQFCKYVAVVETDNWLRFSVKIGSQKPAYATGSGRAMFAYLPETEIQHLLESFQFERLTTKTVSSRRSLLANLKEVRKRGVSTVDSGTVAGVIAVAAPIFGADGHVAAAVREAEMVNIPFLGALAGCSARRSERRVASHTSEEQRRNAPGSAAKNGILAFSASLSVGGPTARVAERIPAVEVAVLDAAEDISRILGYRGEWPCRPIRKLICPMA